MEEIKESHESEKELRERAELWLESLKLNRLCEGKPFARDAHNDIRALIAHLDAKCGRVRCIYRALMLLAYRMTLLFLPMVILTRGFLKVRLITKPASFQSASVRW